MKNDALVIMGLSHLFFPGELALPAPLLEASFLEGRESVLAAMLILLEHPSKDLYAIFNIKKRSAQEDRGRGYSEANWMWSISANRRAGTLFPAVSVHVIKPEFLVDEDLQILCAAAARCQASVK